jgi:TPR repeat protein
MAIVIPFNRLHGVPIVFEGPRTLPVQRPDGADGNLVSRRRHGYQCVAAGIGRAPRARIAVAFCGGRAARTFAEELAAATLEGRGTTPMTADHHHADMLRREGATKLNLPALQDGAAPDDEFLQAVREAAEGEYEVLGEMGRGQRGAIVYLARDLSTTRLVALRLEQGDAPDEFSLEVVKQLDSSIPAVESSCPRCGAPQRGWGRFCPQCGSDLSGLSAELHSSEELLQAVKDASAGEFEVLGEMDRAEGGGRVYFARDVASGGLVALRLLKEKTAAGAEEYALNKTRVLKPLAEELVGDAPAKPTPKVRPPSSPAVPAPPAPRKAPAPKRPAPRLRRRQGLALPSRRTLTIVGFVVGAVVVAAVLFALWDRLRSGGSEGPEVEEAVPTVGSVEVMLRGRVPNGATVSVDGRAYPLDTTITLMPGPHVFRVEAPGYLTVVDSLPLSDGQSLIWTAPSMERQQQSRAPSRPRPPPARPVTAPPAETTVVAAAPVDTAPSLTCETAYAQQAWTEARRLCFLAANAGDPLGNYVQGLMYERGNGVPADPKVARTYYQLGTDGGHAPSAYRLALLLRDGRGGDRDLEGGATVLWQAAQTGYPPAQRDLGIAYAEGTGAKRDAQQAETWLRRAAEQGDAPAQGRLGMLYRDGARGVSKDDVAAVRWFTLAAQQGLKESQVFLAQMYRDGKGVTQSDSAAIYWYERAGTPEALAEAGKLRR